MRLYKGIVLFRGDARHRLEPVSVVGSTVLYRPFKHCLCDTFCHFVSEGNAALLGESYRFVGGRIEALLHHAVTEEHYAKVFGYLFFIGYYFTRLGQNYPLGLLHNSFLQYLGGIADLDIYTFLKYDFAAVGYLVDVMNGSTRHLDAVSESRLVHLKAVEALAAE